MFILIGWSRHTTPPRRLALSVSLFALVAGIAGTTAGMAETPQTVGEIVTASIAAAGGANLDAAAAIRREGSMHLDSPIFGVLDGTWEVVFVPGKKGYQLADFGVGATATGWDGTAGWENGAMGLRDLDPGELGLNRLGWEINILHALKREGLTTGLARLDDDEIEDRPHRVLEYTGESGEKLRIYVDAQTSLITRITTTLENPQLGTAAVTLGYADFADFEGIRLPQTTTQSIENVWEVKTTYEKTEIDPKVADTIFAKPGS